MAEGAADSLPRLEAPGLPLVSSSLAPGRGGRASRPLLLCPAWAAGPGLWLCPQVTAEEAREHWESGYAFSLTHCSHTAW